MQVAARRRSRRRRRRNPLRLPSSPPELCCGGAWPRGRAPSPCVPAAEPPPRIRQQRPSLFPVHPDGSGRAPSPRPPVVAAEPSSARRSSPFPAPSGGSGRAFLRTLEFLHKFLLQWPPVICTSSLMHCVMQ
ncbi:unnamed protein product [Urochloa humidicola]